MRRLVLILTALAAIAIGLFPPFSATLVVEDHDSTTRIGQPSTFRLLFDPPGTELHGGVSSHFEYALDVPLLLGEWAVLAVVCLVLLAATRKRGEPEGRTTPGSRD